MKFQIQVTKDNLYQKYYTLLNGIFKLSSRELTIIIELSNHIAQLVSMGYSLEEATMYALSTEARIKLSALLEISKFNLNNYIKTLRDKGVIKHNKKKLVINSAVFINVNEIDEFELEAKLILNK